MFRKMWESLMNSKNNSIKELPKAVRLQIMISLSFMWSLIFALSLGIINLFPQLVIVHIALLGMGLFGTSWLLSIFNKDKNK